MSKSSKRSSQRPSNRSDATVSPPLQFGMGTMLLALILIAGSLTLWAVSQQAGRPHYFTAILLSMLIVFGVVFFIWLLSYMGRELNSVTRHAYGEPVVSMMSSVIRNSWNAIVMVTTCVVLGSLLQTLGDVLLKPSGTLYRILIWGAVTVAISLYLLYSFYQILEAQRLLDEQQPKKESANPG